MNQGLYPIIYPEGQNARRPAGQVRTGFSVGVTYGQAMSAAGLNSTGDSVALSASVRTRILAVNGRGAFRFGLLNNGSGGSSASFLLELWIDGVRVVSNNNNGNSLGNGNYAHYVGGSNGTNITASLDWVPFETSAEVWVTASNAGTYNHGYLIDIHQ